MATGVSAPVRPISTSIPSSFVFTCSAGYLYAMAQRGDRLLKPISRCRVARIGKCFAALLLQLCIDPRKLPVRHKHFAPYLDGGGNRKQDTGNRNVLLCRVEQSGGLFRCLRFCRRALLLFLLPVPC